MYTVLLREFDYAEDFDIAELEIELEDEGLLEEFIQRCESRFGLPWSTIRKGAQKISRASAVLHEMDPSTYPEADSWAKSIATDPRQNRTVQQRLRCAFLLQYP